MYFWNITELKAKLRQARITDREAMPYLVVYSGFTAATVFSPVSDMNLQDIIAGLSAIVASVLGPIFVYRKNGGAAGSQLLQRFFVLGWIVLIRVLAVFMPIFIVVGIHRVREMIGIAPVERTHWFDIAVGATALLVFYSRLGCHVREVASKGATEESVP
jgi:hypothetical protein